MNLDEQMHFSAWVESFRPKTLLLALSAIITGSALAYWQGMFKWSIALLAIITASLLQVLSNLANDYGDTLKGTDFHKDESHNRGMQKGLITPQEMKQVLGIVMALCTLFGIILICVSCQNLTEAIGFIILGLTSIIAAITYTVGKRPYGYIGFGDISVLLFFGWLGVCGSCYLQTKNYDLMTLIPATASGLLIVAVLNINNLRDMESDRKNGKITLAVRMGPVFGRYYHLALLCSSVLLFAYFGIAYLKSSWGWLFILTLPLIYQHGKYVLTHKQATDMVPMLEKMVKITLLTNLLFAIGVILTA